MSCNRKTHGTPGVMICLHDLSRCKSLGKRPEGIVNTPCTPLPWIVLQNAIEHRDTLTYTDIFPSWSHITGEHVKTAQRWLSATRAFPSPSNPAIRDKAREMEQMFHKWEWQRESWPPMVFLISPRRTTKEWKGAATLLQHTLRSNSTLLIIHVAWLGPLVGRRVGFVTWGVTTLQVKW